MPMIIVKTYKCEDCTERLGKPFTFDKMHFDRNEPLPECPGCEMAAATVQVPAGFAIGGSNVSKAVDETYHEMQRMGFTDMKDKLREGDIAVPGLKPEVQKAVDGYWGGGQQLVQAARSHAALARAEGVNPLEIVQKARKTHQPQPRLMYPSK